MINENTKKRKQISKKGKCIVCGKKTEDKHLFADDFRGESGYWVYCCDECWEYLQEKLPH